MLNVNYISIKQNGKKKHEMCFHVDDFQKYKMFNHVLFKNVCDAILKKISIASHNRLLLRRRLNHTSVRRGQSNMKEQGWRSSEFTITKVIFIHERICSLSKHSYNFQSQLIMLWATKAIVMNFKMNHSNHIYFHKAIK